MQNRRLEEDRPGVWIVALNRRDKRNALNAETIKELVTLFSGAARAGARAIVLAAEGDDFCAGLDLVEHHQADRTPAEFRQVWPRWHQAFNKVKYGGVPIFAVLKEAVGGGGLELASAGHVRVADAGTYLALSEGQRGLFTGGGRRSGSRPDRHVADGRHDADRPGLSGDDLGLAQYLVEDRLAEAIALARRSAEDLPLTNFAFCAGVSHRQNMSALDAAFAKTCVAGIVNTRPEARTRLAAFADRSGARIRPKS